ncbi:MAG: murein biosynthesis integral membrane protein MurJ [Deltaproteobacteria bacterium]|nr:murein biosynthesis integral membrane protein MurJ [Deltaproteobacteria bacterium]
MDPTATKRKTPLGGAFFVGAGIGLSRISGFIRESLFAHYFGNTDAADAFKGALRIPNLLQNLFGEGVLSASFIPVYSGLLAREDSEGRGRVASAVLTLLVLVTSLITALGMTFAPALIDILTPGFEGGKRELAIELVRIFFPATMLLVCSAWCLGILNSHHRFFLSYAAPIAWNGAIIATLLAYRQVEDDAQLAIIAAWGVVLGSALQFLIQVPSVLRLLPKLRPMLGGRDADVRKVMRNFFPVLFGRGIVQLSAFVDSFIASLLATGAVAALSYAQMIYFLPVSLFAMSVSAAELPRMSGMVGTDAGTDALRERLRAGLRQILFFIVPTTIGFIFFGNLIVGSLFESGKFGARDTALVWITLGGMAVGLVPSTLGRLYSSTLYALGDAQTPLRVAIVRVTFSVIFGAAGALLFLREFPDRPELGVVGLALGAGLSSWIEFLLLRRAVARRVGEASPEPRLVLTLIGVALGGSALAAAALSMPAVSTWPLVPRLLLCGVIAGSVYIGALTLLNVKEARALLRRARR